MTEEQEIPNPMDENTYLKDRVQDQIDWYDMKSGYNKRLYLRCQYLLIVAAALVTFSGVFDAAKLGWVQFAVPALGAIIAITSGVLGICKYQEHWVEYRTTAEQLKHEKHLYITKSEPYEKDDAFNLFVLRIEGLISKENSKWMEYIREPLQDSQTAQDQDS